MTLTASRLIDIAMENPVNTYRLAACRLESLTADADRPCIGLHLDTGEFYAPHGLVELEQWILRMNPNFAQPEPFLKKARSCRARWGWLCTPNCTQPNDE
ncbi:MAG TPA: hypothetical protein VN798_17060 [Pseudomonas sp.]|nr:hypothetical protein [Pseudomonas sp.]